MKNIYQIERGLNKDSARRWLWVGDAPVTTNALVKKIEVLTPTHFVFVTQTTNHLAPMQIIVWSSATTANQRHRRVDFSKCIAGWFQISQLLLTQTHPTWGDVRVKADIKRCIEELETLWVDADWEALQNVTYGRILNVRIISQPNSTQTAKLAVFLFAAKQEGNRTKMVATLWHI